MYCKAPLVGKLLPIMLGLVLLGKGQEEPVRAQGAGNVVRRVNAPYFQGTEGIPAGRKAIFWFGEVTPTTNHVNVRVGYNDERLEVTVHVFDKNLIVKKLRTGME